MNNMPGAGGVGGGYGAGGGMPPGVGGVGGMPPGVGGVGQGGGQQGGAPVDHQQQQQQMMMQRQQMAYMQQQQAAAAARGGMYMQPGQHGMMMQPQPNMYGGMQQPQPQQPGGSMDAAQMQKYHAAAAARQQQMQGMQPQMSLEQMRNMRPEERAALMAQRQQQMSGGPGAAAAAGRHMYPPGMQPQPGGSAAHMQAAMAAGHMGGPGQSGVGGVGGMQQQQPGGGVGPGHFVKQEMMGGPGGGMMGGSHQAMNVKQEPGMLHNIKQEPGTAAAHSMQQQQQHAHMQHAMQQQQGGDDQHMQQQQQQQPQQQMQPPPAAAAANMARNQAAFRAMTPQQQQQIMHRHQMQQQAAAAMHGADPSMTVQQALSAKVEAEQRIRQAAAAQAGHMQPPLPHHMDPAAMMQQRQRDAMMMMQQQQQHGMPQAASMQQMQQQQHQLQMQQQHQLQQQHMQQQQQQHGMTHAAMIQQQRQQQQQQQMAAAAAAGSMGPPTVPGAMAVPAAAAAAPTGGPHGGQSTAAAAAAPSAAEEEAAKEFKRRVDELKAKYGAQVDRHMKRHEIDNKMMPAFINRMTELFTGQKTYSDKNMGLVGRLEESADALFEKHSITSSITEALKEWVSKEAEEWPERKVAKKEPVDEDAEDLKMHPPQRLLPDPWPLDVRARRVRVPDGLAAHVRSRRMDERLISRRKRHADVMADEEELPLWSARRMRYEADLEKELEEFDRIEGKGAGMMNGVPCKIEPEVPRPPPVVNSIPKSELMAKVMKRKLQSGEMQLPQPRLEATLPEEALKELSMLQWRMETDDRPMFTDTTDFLVAILLSTTVAPPLHVLIPASYPARSATVLYDRSFPRQGVPQLRRLGEVLEKRLSTVTAGLQGPRIHAIADTYRSTFEHFFKGTTRAVPHVTVVQHSAAAASAASAAPPTVPMLHHIPTTFRPQAKFRPNVDGNAKSRMVY